MRTKPRRTFARSVRVSVASDYHVEGSIDGEDIFVRREFPNRHEVELAYLVSYAAGCEAYRAAGDALIPIVTAEIRLLWEKRKP